MPDSVFSRIIAGELPSAKVWEDDDLLAILDLQPVNKGHVLILAKCECADIRDVADSILAKVLPLARDVGIALCEAFGYSGFNIHQSNGVAAGQDVMHYHLHVWPRREKAEVRLVFRDEPEYEGNELSEVAEQLSKAVLSVRSQDAAV
jgi:histidine triad (HIT) family protein